MRVTRLFLNECVHSEADAQQERAELDKLLMVATLCNNARLRPDNPADAIGDPTEGALLVYAQRYFDVQAYQANCPRLFELPFSSRPASRNLQSAMRKIGALLSVWVSISAT